MGLPGVTSPLSSPKLVLEPASDDLSRLIAMGPKALKAEMNRLQQLKAQNKRKYADACARLADVDAYREAMEWVIAALSAGDIEATADNASLSVPDIRRNLSRAVALAARLERVRVAEVERRWQGAVWFDFRRVPYGADDEMANMGRELMERGIIKLPFPEIVFVTTLSGNGRKAAMAQFARQDGNVIRCDEALAVATDAQPLWIAHDGEWATKPLFYYLAVLNTKYVTQDRANYHGVERKPRPTNPASHYFTVSIASQYREQVWGGKHASPRLHWRRGHTRSRNERRYWVRPHLVGSRERGVIVHDYSLTEPRP